MSVPTTVRRPARARTGLQTRYRLLLLGAGAVILALITLVQAVSAYSTTYDLFRGIVEVNSTTVDASELALQNIAQASQAAADYALLTSDTPLYEQAQNNIFRSFSLFRDEMFILRGNLQSDEENTAFTVADTFAFSRFWRHVSDLVAERSNDVVARQQYLAADNHVRSWINPALQELETLNFQQMVEAGDQAGSVIATQIILLAIPGLALAALVTYISFLVRRKVRRYLTIGIDAAMVLSWLLLILLLINLLNAPNQLNTMIQDAYRSVSASARVLVDANLANRAESSELLDLERAESWDQRWDTAVERVELRMCGQPGCLDKPFLSTTPNEPNPQIVASANAISAENSAQIQGIIPLVANVTFPREVSALEQARQAFLDYRDVNAQLRDLIAAGNTDEAIALNTSTDDGTSQAAFDRFVAAMDQVRDVNRAVFDEVWQSASSTFQTNRIVFGLIGYALVAAFIVIGVNTRFREL